MMSTTKSPSGTRKKAIAGAVAAALAATLLVVSRGQDDQSQRLVGMFVDASPIDVGNEVRAAGVKVGVVDRIDLDGKLGKVTFKLDKGVLPVHQDARLTLKPINILGENFVELKPGSDSAPMLTSGVVPVANTSKAVTLQDVLNTFEDPTAASLAGLLTTLGEGVDLSGGQLAKALDEMAPAFASANAVGKMLDDQTEALTAIVDRLQPVLAAAADKKGSTLDSLADQADRTLSALSSQHDELRATLKELPPTLDETNATLASLTSVSRSATPMLRSIRPVTDNLREVTDELGAFADTASPALTALTPVVKELGPLLRDASPVASALRGSAAALPSVARSTRVVGDELLNKNLTGLMEFVRKWALSTNERDGLSHYFRGVFHVTPASLNSLLGAPVVPALPGTKSKKPTGTKPPGLNATEDGLLDGVTGLLGNLDGVLGLSSSQETNLLGQLLGGH